MKMGCRGQGARALVGMLGMPGDAGRCCQGCPRSRRAGQGAARGARGSEDGVRVLPGVPEVPRSRSGCSEVSGPRTWRCPAELVLKGLRGGREGRGLPACGGGVCHGTTRPGAGLCGNMENSESPENSEGRGESGASWELWWTGGSRVLGSRKPQGPCRGWGPSWVPRSLWDIGFHGDAALLSKCSALFSSSPARLRGGGTSSLSFLRNLFWPYLFSCVHC